MKNIAMAVFCTMLISAEVCFAVANPVLNDEKDKISYSVGFQMGEDLKRQNRDIDPDALLKGVEDVVSGANPQFSEAEMKATLSELKKELAAQYKSKQLDKRAELAKTKEAYRGEGREFLAENKKKEGVVELPSGLQYRVLSEGSGKKPGPNDTVLIQYRGTLIDGTEFDSSYRKKEPQKFRVDGVVPGLREALQLMKEGAKWQLFVPADLAYGERGPLADRTVIFDMELISVESPK